MTDELKPCPFCGGEAYICHPITSAGVMEGEHLIRCDGCTIETSWYRKPEAAIAAWNRRAQPPEVKALVEAAKEVAMWSIQDSHGYAELRAALALFVEPEP